MSRDKILAAVRAANRGHNAVAAAAASINHPIPHETAQQRCTAFTRRLQVSGVTVERLATWDDVPAAVVRHILVANLPLKIRHGADPLIAALPWHLTPTLQRRTGAASGDDMVSLSRALSGITETGTLVLGSGADNPVTLAFLPDFHIVALDAALIVATIDEALAGIGDASDEPRLPRTVNLISGASRTGDIGGRLVMGAHGPRQLVVLLIGAQIENGAI